MPQSYRSSHLTKGRAYHESFRSSRYRAFLWLREQAILDRVLQGIPDSGRATVLDFACGTGRVLSYLRPKVASIVGVDVSGSMLAVARQASPDALLLRADLTRGNALAGQRFDLITAFRFFPNAEADLRRDAIASLVSLLADDGVVVLNNHQNAGSLNAMSGPIRGLPPSRWMSEGEVVSLVQEAGLRVTEQYPVGVVPGSDRFLPCPIRAAVAVDRLVARTPLSRFAQDVVYVCRFPA